MNNQYKNVGDAVAAQVEINRLVWQVNLDEGHERLNREYARECAIRCFADLQAFYVANFGEQIPIIFTTKAKKHAKRDRKK